MLCDFYLTSSTTPCPGMWVLSRLAPVSWHRPPSKQFAYKHSLLASKSIVGPAPQISAGATERIEPALQNSEEMDASIITRYVFNATEPALREVRTPVCSSLNTLPVDACQNGGCTRNQCDGDQAHWELNGESQDVSILIGDCLYAREVWWSNGMLFDVVRLSWNV